MEPMATPAKIIEAGETRAKRAKAKMTEVVAKPPANAQSEIV